MPPIVKKRPAAPRQPVAAKHPKLEEESEFLYTITAKEYDGFRIIEVTVNEHKRVFKTKAEAAAAARTQFYSDLSDDELQECLTVDKRAQPPDSGILMRDEDFSCVCHIQKNEIVGDNMQKAITVHITKEDDLSLAVSLFTMAGEEVGTPCHFKSDDKIKKLCRCVREVFEAGDVTFYNGSDEVGPCSDVASFGTLVARVFQHGKSKNAFYKLYTKISVSPDQQRGIGPPNCEDADLCAKLFRTKADAAAYAHQLVDLQQLSKDGYPTMKCVKDCRKRPPSNGLLLRWHDKETGAYAEVHISKYSAVRE
eukprot:TRINITY_DN70122_c0_g1_i1.p1 TRINITY_DN70122_c0_g1~~TRINITY_DN70122_c0_g1_i1.p1  ORF type:complete len:309 (+),score=41.65 TRINITY_DN70122_c0_g1_i1:41-967(+)